MIEPSDWEPDGQLKECDRCGFAFRWKELESNSDGYWVCQFCVDDDEEWQQE